MGLCILYSGVFFEGCIFHEFSRGVYFRNFREMKISANAKIAPDCTREVATLGTWVKSLH